MSDNTVTITALGILATCVGGLIWIIKFMFNRLLPLIEKGNRSQEKLAELTKANTEATRAADVYLKQRNGRDNEMHSKNLAAWDTTRDSIEKMIESAQTIADGSTEKIITAIKQQEVETQVVRTQVVDERQDLTALREDKERRT